MRKLKIVFGTLPSLYSLYFANYCLRVLNIRFSCLLLSIKPVNVDGSNLSAPSSLGFLLKRFGWRYSLFLLLNLIGMWLLQPMRFLLPKHRRLWSYAELSERFGIELVQHKDFNDADLLRSINAKKPDVLLINGCNQILKQPLISTPQRYCLNIHPSLLPNDRGVDPLFQKMLRDEKTVDTTLHELTEMIDAGPIYTQRQTHYCDKKSYLSLVVQQAIQGALVFNEFLGGVSQPSPQAPNPDHPYRSWPSRQEIRIFNRQGKRWLSLVDLYKTVTFSINDKNC